MSAITSNGTGGGLWSSTASWTGAVVPTEGDTVQILDGDTISGVDYQTTITWTGTSAPYTLTISEVAIV